MTQLTHPDPDWFKRLAPQAHMRLSTDICQYCPHARSVHDDHGCQSPSTHQFNRTPCACTNRRGGALFGDALTLKKLTASSGEP